jgi:hypothetical protein
LYEQYTARHSRNHRVSGLLRGANLQVCSRFSNRLVVRQQPAPRKPAGLPACKPGGSPHLGSRIFAGREESRG